MDDEDDLPIALTPKGKVKAEGTADQKPDVKKGTKDEKKEKKSDSKGKEKKEKGSTKKGKSVEKKVKVSAVD
jgi:hypothetical protein